MNGNAPISPRKIVLAMIVTGIVIVASVGGIFTAANYAGLITSEISVSGYARGSNATQCHLYIDGANVATTYLGRDYYYEYTNNGYFYFYNIDVAANAKHEFQVITSLGEKSDPLVEYIPYGEHTSMSLNIVKKQVQVTVYGEYRGNSTQRTTSVSLYVGNEMKGSDYVSPSSPDFSISAKVYENTYHTFKLTANSNYDYLVNETMIYVGSASMTINMNIEY